MSKLGGGNQQAHHVNQDAVYGSSNGGKIPYSDGISILLTREQHKQLHDFMREFYKLYQKMGPLANSRPTNAEYSQRMFNGLLKVGIDKQSAASATTKARIQRIEHGYLDENYIPSIPSR